MRMQAPTCRTIMAVAAGAPRSSAAEAASARSQTNSVMGAWLHSGRGTHINGGPASNRRHAWCSDCTHLPLQFNTCGSWCSCTRLIFECCPASLPAAAVILGGGAGTRLYPLTKNRAKPAVPIGGAYRLVSLAHLIPVFPSYGCLQRMAAWMCG